MQYRAACVLVGFIVVLGGISQAAELTARKKVPVPDDKAQEASRKALAAVYSVRFKDAQTDTAKSALAKELVAAARGVPVGSSDQFVLLKIGCSVAAGAGDAATVMAAVIGLEKDFDMPLAKLAAESLLTAAGRASGYSRHKDVAEASLFVADLVSDAGDYEMALRLCEVGRSSAKEARQHELGDKFLAKVEELKREQKEFQNYREAIARLEREPHDPAANLAAGRYLCFVIGDWDEGLTMLALGADAELKSAALKDLKFSTSAEGQVAIGDVWWDLAEKEAVLAKERFQQRAAFWYELALPDLTGLARAKAEKRLLEVFPDYAEVSPGKSQEPSPTPSTPVVETPFGFHDAIARLTFEADTMTRIAEGQFVIRDMSQCRNDSLADGPTAINGQVGTALAFDGKDDFVSLKGLAKDFKGVTALTVGMWLRAGDTRRLNFVLDMRSSEAWVLRLMFDEREMTFNTPGGGVIGPCNMSGGWHHVVGTWASGTTRLYLDGKLIAEQSGQQGTITDAILDDCPAFLGRQVVGFLGPRPKKEPRGFVGAIDEFFILRRALSPEEVGQYRLNR